MTTKPPELLWPHWYEALVRLAIAETDELAVGGVGVEGNTVTKLCKDQSGYKRRKAGNAMFCLERHGYVERTGEKRAGALVWQTTAKGYDTVFMERVHVPVVRRAS